MRRRPNWRWRSCGAAEALFADVALPPHGACVVKRAVEQVDECVEWHVVERVTKLVVSEFELYVAPERMVCKRCEHVPLVAAAHALREVDGTVFGAEHEDVWWHAADGVVGTCRHGTFRPVKRRLTVGGEHGTA